MQSITKILKIQKERIRPEKGEIAQVEKHTNAIIRLLKDELKRKKISAEIFVGGSFAKNTLIKKMKYDIDIFVRFDKKYENLSSELEKIIPKNAVLVHGSRDYYTIKDMMKNAEFEIIPTLKIKRPSEAQNITDLSYFHVDYVNKKTKKNIKLADEIRLAKAFAHYSDCYGAESYIHGFSGYAMELLIIHYRSFMNFIKAVAKADVKKQKIVLDTEKLFKNKKNIEMELNEAKLQSPLILIDPTFKDRNALAALSYKTFYNFRDYCLKFLKNPSAKFFEPLDRESLLRKKYSDVTEIKITTDRQSGDIAGTKLKKFSEFFLNETRRFFDVKESLFKYDDKSSGKIILILKEKKERIFTGPPISMEEPLRKFKLEHKKIVVKNGQAFAYGKSPSFEEFFKDFLNEKAKVIEPMSIVGIEIVR